MNDSDLNKMMGSNLRKLRRESRLTQEQLAERLQVSSGLIPKWESGAKGIGKKVLLKLCVIFNVQPYVFCRDERIPVITNAREQEMLYTIREAERLGVCEQIEQYCSFVIGQAKGRHQVEGQSKPAPEVSALVRPGRDVLVESRSREHSAGMTMQDRHGSIGNGKIQRRRKSDPAVGKKDS